jgi:L-lysine epsilon oxidase-like protein
VASVFEYRIHPAVGIARMGNSDTTYFLTAEKPWLPLNPDQRIIPGKANKRQGGGKIRDTDGKLCKQGARFRVFCYEFADMGAKSKDQAPIKIWECEPNDYEIEWTVNVANNKASLKQTMPIGAREKNTPNAVTLKTKTVADLNALKPFTGKPVGRLQLGSCFLGADGRLVVLGSEGAHQRLPNARGANKIAPKTPQNLFWAGWEDDEADGPVTAKVKPKTSSLRGDKTMPQTNAVGAWVVISMPDYGADTRAATSLYDIATNHAYSRAKAGTGYRIDPKHLVTYYQQIAPLQFARYAVGYTIGYHRHKMPFVIPAYTKKHNLKKYMRNAKPTNMIKPESIWEAYSPSGWNGDPEPAPVYRAAGSAAGVKWPDDMPYLEYTSVTEIQQDALTAWAAGTLPPGSDAIEKSSAAMYKPYQIDRAHMETMSGGSFYPGIEVSRQAHWPATWFGRRGCCDNHYDARVTNKVDAAGKPTGAAGPGYLTKDLANPWQSDFVACSGVYWPHARPIEVLPSATPPASYKDWMRVGAAISGIPAGSTMASHRTVAGNTTSNGLVDNWHNLGFVRWQSGSNHLLETERNAAVLDA